MGAPPRGDRHTRLTYVADLLRRLGRTNEAARVLAPIRRDMNVIENDAYHRRLLMYKGMLPADSLLQIDTGDPVQLATYWYGVGNWYVVGGEPERARPIFARVTAGPQWSSFGFIAAEADLHRLQ